MQTARMRRVLLVAVFASTAILTAGAYALGIGTRLELDSVDTRFDVRGTQPAPPSIVFVKIDDATFAVFRRRPVRADLGLRRSVHARTIRALSRAGVKLIVYDVEFTEESDSVRDDNALITAVRDAGNVVLGTTLVDVRRHGATNVFGGGAALAYSRGTPAHSGYPNDPGRVIRRMKREIGGLKTIPVVVAEKLTGEQVTPADVGPEGAWIDYRGPAGAVNSVSLSDVVMGRVPSAALRGKIAIVGAGAPSLQDLHATSTGDSRPMPGPEVHANAIFTALQGFPLSATAAWVGYVMIVLMALATPAACLRLAPMPALAASAGVAVAYLAVVQVAFDAGTILPVVHPMAALALATGGSVLASYAIEAFERQRLRDSFARFVPESVVDRVVQQADGGVLGGQEQEATVLFSDLRGFTAFAQSRPAAEVMSVLNRYLTEMSDVILARDGTLISYMGDGICAVFGAPVERPDHAAQAVNAGKDMLARLAVFNAWLTSSGVGERFEMGIGINTGPVMSGNVGSERRLEYTVIGDTTNIAARLEQLSKSERFQLLIAEATIDAVEAAGGATREQPSLLGERVLAGRSTPIRVWTYESSAKAAV